MFIEFSGPLRNSLALLEDGLVLLVLSQLGGGVDAHLLVVLLEGGQILASLGELALLHALTHVPVDEGPLGVHQIELVVQTGPGLGDGKVA